MLEKYFDHTYLKPEGYEEEVEKLCKEAIEYGFFSVCVQPSFVAFAKEKLKGSSVKVATVVGFPQGVNKTVVKVLEAQEAVKDGADEVDMVMNYGALKAGKKDEVREDIAAVKKAIGDKCLKVILETSQLTEDEIVTACKLADEANADFVKTSTGFYGGGATKEHVALMKKHFSREVKASGGIRKLTDANDMIGAGATRLGASAGVDIMKELKENQQ